MAHFVVGSARTPADEWLAASGFSDALGTNEWEHLFAPQLATLFHEAWRFRSASVRSTSLA